MKSFRERYSEAYNQMQEVLSELSDRALKFQKMVDPDGFWSNVDRINFDQNTTLRNLMPGSYNDLFFRLRGDFLGLQKQDLLEENLEESALKHVQRKLEAKRQRDAEAEKRMKALELEESARERRLFERLKAKYEP